MGVDKSKTKEMKTHKHIHRIFALQCWMVGTNPNKVDGTADRWFMEHAWSQRRERVFILLMALYLRLSPKARRELFQNPPFYDKWKACKKISSQWCWNYGWKYKDVHLTTQRK
jgi:hypothetical protein